MVLRMGETQIIKWTAEGAVKCMNIQSILRREAYVSCRGYIGILQKGHIRL